MEPQGGRDGGPKGTVYTRQASRAAHVTEALSYSTVQQEWVQRVCSASPGACSTWIICQESTRTDGMRIGPTVSSFLEAKQHKNERKDPSTGAGAGGDLDGENGVADGPPRRDGWLGCEQKSGDGRRRPTTNKDPIVRNVAHGWIKRTGHPAGPGGAVGERGIEY